MRVFVKVAETGSFSEAARQLNKSPPVVTRAVASLEADIGARLLTRTTRWTKLTEAGHRQATLQGWGLSRPLSYHVASHLDSGELTTVLSDFEEAPLPPWRGMCGMPP
jgi:Bacterial regulatory helix-turn-helix protein, lysR family